MLASWAAVDFLENLYEHLDRVARSRDGMSVAKARRERSPFRHRDVVTYAEEIRATLVMNQRRTFRLGPIGRVFLDLKGKDAVRWLLHVEVAQSRGRTDPFRMSTETLATLVLSPEQTSISNGLCLDDWFRDQFGLYSRMTLKRLAELDILELIDDPVDELDHRRIGYRVLPSGSHLLADVAKPDTPRSTSPSMSAPPSAMPS